MPELVEDLAEPSPLLRQETRVLLVGAPVLEVDLIVGDVPVAAQDHVVSPLLQGFEVTDELLEKAELGSRRVGAGGAGRQVHRDDPKITEARLDIAPFGVELAAC